MSCLRYCKSTIFQANHNRVARRALRLPVVCDTAKVRFFKQITTYGNLLAVTLSCLRYCKSTIFQANHNTSQRGYQIYIVVCDTAKVRFFKQITTTRYVHNVCPMLFAILQKYDFSSKSQQYKNYVNATSGCLRYCKSTIFQANHNSISLSTWSGSVVCDTAKVRFFKQITTIGQTFNIVVTLFAILQKYDFSSKSQPRTGVTYPLSRCLRYCKSTIFQANHNS